MNNDTENEEYFKKNISHSIHTESHSDTQLLGLVITKQCSCELFTLYACRLQHIVNTE